MIVVPSAPISSVRCATARGDRSRSNLDLRPKPDRLRNTRIAPVMLETNENPEPAAANAGAG